MSDAEYLTLAETARRFGRAAQTFYNRLAAGDPWVLSLKPEQPVPGGPYRFPRAAVEAALDQGRQRPMGFRRKSRVVPPVAKSRRSIARSA